ncbi:MAG: histidinol dehydrogenase [Bacteroidia bacterium]|nr:histidinol dehydrogenase [Bacteroidia bacterium]MCX7651804.1 histidinol dehydrogenase [Bacteroidia bacterium]MDW8417094.1 histidinol dehydrogenase [Bacteroidia bacterium]
MKWQHYQWYPDFPTKQLRATQPPLPDVEGIFRAVEEKGDEALYELTQRYDGVKLSALRVSEAEIHAAQVPPALAEAIHAAYENIWNFHFRQLPQEIVVETQRGVLCGLRYVPIARVGLYVPGGTAPLISSVLMLGIPAKIAGVPQIVLATPPSSNGKIHEALLYAARICGISEVYAVGGAQAIAALTIGTQSIPAVDKIAGPGNRFVQAAKLEAARRGVAIDMPAGPSEVIVLADSTAHPEWIAADLIAQAEHGSDSLVGLITTDAELIPAVEMAIKDLLSHNPRRAYAEETLNHSWSLTVPDILTGIQIVNAVAPEHLILACEKPECYLSHLRQVGSVFLGHLTPESAGDYASGTNHVLPTGGMARSFGSLTVLSFMRSFTYQQLNPEGVKALTPAVLHLAEAEGLLGHAESMRLRYAAI